MHWLLGVGFTPRLVARPQHTDAIRIRCLTPLPHLPPHRSTPPHSTPTGTALPYPTLPYPILSHTPPSLRFKMFLQRYFEPCFTPLMASTQVPVVDAITVTVTQVAWRSRCFENFERLDEPWWFPVPPNSVSGFAVLWWITCAWPDMWIGSGREMVIELTWSLFLCSQILINTFRKL